MKTALTLLLLVCAVPAAVIAQHSEILKPTNATPRITQHVEPIYPHEARAAGIEGTVLIECLVAADGTVLATGAIEKSIDPKFDEAAIAAVAKWKFTARTDNLNPRLVHIPVHFKLHKPVNEIDTTRIAAR